MPGAGGRPARLPPRPDEVDDTGAPASAAASQGATGVISALGRAFSTRRTGASPRAQRTTRRRGVPKDDQSESGDDETLREEPEDGDDDEGPETPAALKEARDKALKVWEERAPEVKRRLNNLLSTVVGPQNLEERLHKALREVSAAEERYKPAVDELDALRLALEETLAANFAYVQRLESDRLRAAASVLKQFHASIAALPKLIDGSLERVGQTLELVRPENDLKGLMERRRSVGPLLSLSRVARATTRTRCCLVGDRADARPSCPQHRSLPSGARPLHVALLRARPRHVRHRPAQV